MSASTATPGSGPAPEAGSARGRGSITVVGAREHTLQNVSVSIPKRALTVFTGVSGSGKSSLVFATIAAESQRLVNETYSAFVQGFMPAQARPDVDHLDGLTAAIVVDQSGLGANPRSTVGTTTDANAMLRILFSRLATPSIGGPKAYSFNVPSVSGAGAVTTTRGGRQVKERRSFAIVGGMCPRCEGAGRVSDIDLGELYDETLSLAQGALRVPGYSMDGWYGRLFSGFGFDLDLPLEEYSRRELDDLLYKAPTKITVDGVNLTFEGVVLRVQRSILSKDREAMQPHVRAFVDRVVTFATCPDCEGTRLTQGARSSTIDGVSIADACAMQVSDLAAWVASVDDPGVTPLVAGLTHLLDAFVTIGLGYLTLSRPSGSLSGGEAQRLRMIRHLGSALTDVTYVFDEPTTGLHPHDIERMNTVLRDLRDKGNTVLVVEHKPEVIAIADHVVDLGPGAGSAGGRICYQGDVAGLRASGTVTGRHLDDRVTVKDTVRSPTGALQIRGASANNLRDVDVDLPLGVLTVVTGVAGSGKSSLLMECLPADADVVHVDQSAIKGSRRSNPATYTGLLDPLRKAFAKANGVKPALFSANSEGACPTCNGAGVVFTDLAMMATVSSPCDDCEGRRFAPEVLEHTLAGRSIADVLEMSAGDALAFTTDDAPVPAAAVVLQRLVDVGLGYLTIGQPLTTLSGGERQRLKLATHMSTRGGIYVLDEPTSGLHLADVAQLLALLDRLVDGGASVIVIEHHLAVVAHADHVVDLGPGAGHEGGTVVFQGTPRRLAATRSTTTGQHLARYVDAPREVDAP